MVKFNRINFFILILISHLALAYILIFGTIYQISTSIFLFFIECSFCSTAIYHRLLSHRSWSTWRFVEVVGTIGGIFTFTGTPITRTLSHRYHHKYADTLLDPHSPKVMGIFKTYFPMLVRNRKMNPKIISDILQDPFHRFCHENYFYIIFLTFIGFSFLFGFKWAMAAIIAPGALTWMNISLCNILCHLGKNETIINNNFLGLLTFGEGWHNDHHANPDSPDFGKNKFDIGYMWICLLKK